MYIQQQPCHLRTHCSATDCQLSYTPPGKGNTLNTHYKVFKLTVNNQHTGIMIQQWRARRQQQERQV